MTATKWRSQSADGGDCDVMIRRKQSESFEAMVIRAAGMVADGHHPPPTPAPTKDPVAILDRTRRKLAQNLLDLPTKGTH